VTETPWYILRCIAERERSLRNELLEKVGLHSYVPLERNVVTLRGRSIQKLRPLVPGYVFVCGIGKNDWDKLRGLRHYLSKLSIDGKPAMLKDSQVTLIRDMERWHNAQLRDRRQFKKGERVRIKSSPFGSMEALLRSVRDDGKVRLDGSWQGRKLSMDTTVDNIEKIA
jgi:transcription antitermination factor NusG